MAKPSRDLPPGVRGPSGPSRQAVEKRSLPILVILNRLPRWLVVVVLAAMLVLGLILTGPWAWVGGVLLLIITGFLFWLLVLAWPVLPTSARLIRLVVVGGALGISILKMMNRI